MVLGKQQLLSLVRGEGEPGRWQGNKGRVGDKGRRTCRSARVNRSSIPTMELVHAAEAKDVGDGVLCVVFRCTYSLIAARCDCK